jgi:hypothetical protein
MARGARSVMVGDLSVVVELVEEVAQPPARRSGTRTTATSRGSPLAACGSNPASAARTTAPPTPFPWPTSEGTAAGDAELRESASPRPSSRQGSRAAASSSRSRTTRLTISLALIPMSRDINVATAPSSPLLASFTACLLHFRASSIRSCAFPCFLLPTALHLLEWAATDPPTRFGRRPA